MPVKADKAWYYVCYLKKKKEKKKKKKMKYSEKAEFIKECWSLVGPTLNFEGSPGVHFLNFEGGPGSFPGSLGPISRGLGTTFKPCPPFLLERC